MEMVLAKLEAVLPEAAAPPPPPRCLVLDVSSSMDEYASTDDLETKIEALRQLVAGLPLAPTYAFSDYTQRIEATRIPDPSGSTNLAGALDRIKQDGWLSAILITDGAPNDAAAAL